MREGVSAADKYAELEARGEERSRCECHDEKMYWAKDPVRSGGGRWLCSEKRKQEVLTSYYLNQESFLRAKREHYHEVVKSDPILMEKLRSVSRDWHRLND